VCVVSVWAGLELLDASGHLCVWCAALVFLFLQPLFADYLKLASVAANPNFTSH